LRSKATLQVFFRLAFVTLSVRLARIGFDTIKNPHAIHTLVMHTINDAHLSVYESRVYFTSPDF